MNFTRQIQLSMIWVAAIVCFASGLYISLEHTAHFFANHNYLFSPFADDILDNVNYTYPIALRQESWTHLFDPFAVHRVVTERVQEVFDFLITNGLQVIQPYRITLLLWLNLGVFTRFVIFANTRLQLPEKMFLTGVYSIFLFAGISINNYVSTMQVTWPLILLLALLSFIGTEKYCTLALEKGTGKLALGYIFLVTLLVNLALYTFNIGLLLWPIIFVLLIKRGVFFKLPAVWLLVAGMTYYFYVSNGWPLNAIGESQGSFHSITVLQQLTAIFLCMARVLSFPWIAAAFSGSSVVTIAIGLAIVCSSVLFVFLYLKKKNFSSADTVLFAYFIFNVLTVITITVTRYRYEEAGIGWRFLTCSLEWEFCLLMLILLALKNSPRVTTAINVAYCVLMAILLVGVFHPKDVRASGGTYDLGLFNQIFISEATGIPINDNFMQASKIYETSGILAHHLGLIAVEKKYHKGPFAFWPASYMNHPISELHFQELSYPGVAKLSTIYDYRHYRSSGVLINVVIKNMTPLLNSAWDIVFTNDEKDIIGFAISAPDLQPLWKMVMMPASTLFWRGAVNTAYFHPHSAVVIAWAVSRENKVMYNLGKLDLATVATVQNEPTWEWHKTIHFGV